MDTNEQKLALLQRQDKRARRTDNRVSRVLGCSEHYLAELGKVGHQEALFEVSALGAGSGRVYTPSDPRSREDWLLGAAELIKLELLEPLGITLAPFRVSCSWPHRGGLGRSVRVRGECWPPQATADGIAQVKISPNLGSVVDEVLPVLIHEMIHVARPTAGHGPQFRAIAVAVGLKPPMTTATPSQELVSKLGWVAAQLGDYPHRRLGPEFGSGAGVAGEPSDGPAPSEPIDAPKKQNGSRMLKLECPLCGYPVRTTRRWIEIGLPLCPLDGYALLEVSAGTHLNPAGGM